MILVVNKYIFIFNKHLLGTIQINIFRVVEYFNISMKSFMYIIFWEALSVNRLSRTRARWGSQLVPATTPRYGAAASRRIAGTADFRPSVRDHDASSRSYILSWCFRARKRISSIKHFSRPYPCRVRITPWVPPQRGVAGGGGGGDGSIDHMRSIDGRVRVQRAPRAYSVREFRARVTPGERVQSATLIRASLIRLSTRIIVAKKWRDVIIEPRAS